MRGSKQYDVKELFLQQLIYRHSRVHKIRDSASKGMRKATKWWFLADPADCDFRFVLDQTEYPDMRDFLGTLTPLGFQENQNWHFDDLRNSVVFHTKLEDDRSCPNFPSISEIVIKRALASSANLLDLDRYDCMYFV